MTDMTLLGSTWLGSLGNPSLTTITFQIANAITTDSNGNPIASGVTEITVDAVLTRAGLTESTQIREQYFAGDDVFGWVLRGRIGDSSNSTFPAAIQNQISPSGRCTIDGKTGAIRLAINSQNPYGAAANIGQKFYAIFIPD